MATGITPRLALIVKNLSPGLTECGKIKIGARGKSITSAKGKSFQPPTKLDHFRVTTLERGMDGNFKIDQAVHKLYGEQPRSLPIYLLYDEIELNFQARYNCFHGKNLWCAGDGEGALRMENGGRLEVACPCERQAPDYPGEDRCKLYGSLSVIVAGVERVGGVWKFRTTSYNSIVGIMSSLALMKRITGGPLSGIPLDMTLSPKTGINPITGDAVSIFVVGLEFKGNLEALKQYGVKQALEHATHAERIRQIEFEARRFIEASPMVIDPVDESEDGLGGPVTDANMEDSKDLEKPGQSLETSGVEGERDPGERRQKVYRFEVPPEKFTFPQIETAGITPDQLLALRAAMKRNAALGGLVRAHLKRIGYPELSFLTEKEAELLMSNDAEKVDCPECGDKVLKSFCLGHCEKFRNEGRCTALDSEGAESDERAPEIEPASESV